MASDTRQAVGLEYLELVTTLLQRARRASPTGGVWEAADLQWSWRRDQHRDPAAQTFWLDGGAPVAALVFTNWGDYTTCDVLSASHDSAAALERVWPRAVEQMQRYAAQPIEMLIRSDDHALIDAAAAEGFEPTAEADITTWMPSAERPAPVPLPDGFELVARSDDPTRPHHMIARNGEDVAERLAECSLYRPELDLAIYAPDGEPAAYTLFWADPVTGVGLVEPMRTEDRYQGAGFGRRVLTAGLERLADHGCDRLKVSYKVGNEAARRLYLGAGFRSHGEGSETRTYRRMS